MSGAFILHLLITSCIFYILATGCKFFLKLRLTIDFSYMMIVLFGSYAGVLLHMTTGMGMISAILSAWLMSIPFTLCVVFLSQRLQGVYFTIGTLSLYSLGYQLALNRESLTGGSFGLSGMTRVLWGSTMLYGLDGFFIMISMMSFIIIVGLSWFQRTYLFTLLRGRGEQGSVIRALGISMSWYTFVMVLITSACAVIGGNLYAFYYLFIDPQSFWFVLMIPVLVIAFLSYGKGEGSTLLIALIITFVYEYLRFFKIVDPIYLGYLRESLFALIIMVSAYMVFKRTSFGRVH